MNCDAQVDPATFWPTIPLVCRWPQRHPDHTMTLPPRLAGNPTMAGSMNFSRCDTNCLNGNSTLWSTSGRNGNTDHTMINFLDAYKACHRETTTTVVGDSHQFVADLVVRLIGTDTTDSGMKETTSITVFTSCKGASASGWKVRTQSAVQHSIQQMTGNPTNNLQLCAPEFLLNSQTLQQQEVSKVTAFHLRRVFRTALSASLSTAEQRVLPQMVEG